jgi:ADP-heptose:LPS heptosyltransferase
MKHREIVKQDCSRNARVLIYRLGSLGDTLVAMPALKLVAHAFPNHQRWMLTNFSVSAKAAPMADILVSTGLVHDYLQYPLKLRTVSGMWTLIHHIRALKIDTLVYLAGNRGLSRVLRDILFFRACGIRHFIGVPYHADQRHNIIRQDGRHEFEGARLARCLKVLGNAHVDDPASFDISLQTSEQLRASVTLGTLEQRPIIAVSVGTKADVNDWEDMRWLPLLERLSTQYAGYALVLLGSADEHARCERLRTAWGTRSLNLCGLLSVRESAAVLQRCQVLICHDSGPMHLAAAVGSTCVAIFSSRNWPGQWFPQGSGHQVLYRSMPCQGCGFETCPDRQKACIRSITVDDVLHAVDLVLRDR